jgi:hypothetical protein
MTTILPACCRHATEECTQKPTCITNPNLTSHTPDVTVGTEAETALRLEGIYLEGVPVLCTVCTQTHLQVQQCDCYETTTHL